MKKVHMRFKNNLYLNVISEKQMERDINLLYVSSIKYSIFLEKTTYHNCRI